MEGTQQSGMPFDLKIASLTQDGQVLQFARDTALQILEDDPQLLQPDHQILKVQLRRLLKSEVDWSAIS